MFNFILIAVVAILVIYALMEIQKLRDQVKLLLEGETKLIKAILLRDKLFEQILIILAEKSDKKVSKKSSKKKISKRIKF